MQRCCYGPYGKAPRHLPFRRAAMPFMRWQLRRGLLQPLSSDHPGSPWWRAVNERILRDGCEAVALSGDLTGPTSSQTVDFWMSFADYPTARAWYRAHNGSVVAAYLEHRDLAEAENEPERFFMNVVLCRVDRVIDPAVTRAGQAVPDLAAGGHVQRCGADIGGEVIPGRESADLAGLGQDPPGDHPGHHAGNLQVRVHPARPADPDVLPGQVTQATCSARAITGTRPACDTRCGSSNVAWIFARSCNNRTCEVSFPARRR